MLNTTQKRYERMRIVDNTIERAHESISIRAAHTLYDAGSVGFHFEEGIIHRSGITSPIYINVRVAFGNPVTRVGLSVLLAEHAREMSRPDVVVGVASGGQAPAQELANQLYLPFGFVRKAAKEHGEKKQVEGVDVAGQKTLIVEDVVNLGTSSLPAVEAVRKEGGLVEDVLAVVTYGFTKTKEQFATAGVKLHTLTDVPTIVEVGVARGAISRENADQVLAWLKEQDHQNEKI
jgi:orotate phosphoribosyltransferase